MVDLVIRGATVVDGLGHAPVRADVAVKDGRIVERTAGLMSTDQIVAWTRQALARVPAQAS